MTELCPRCTGVGLFVGEARSLHPHACGACGGVFLDPEESARILRPLRTPDGLPGRPSALRCPHCSQAMTEWTVGTTGVALDSCAAHGTWFDRDETLALATAAARLRGQPAPDLSALKTAGLAPAAVAGAAAALAVHAVAHADVLLASQPAAAAQTTSTSLAHIGADALLAAPDVAPDLALTAVELTATTAQLVGDAASAGVDAVSGVAVEVVAEGALETAGGLLEGLLEFLGNLFN